jgi:hypothetical protein
MALANYTDLLASVASWMNRTDLTAVIPDFVVMAEGRIANDLRIRQQLTTDVLTTVAGTQAVTLPFDYLEFENVSIAGGTETQCLYSTKEHLDANYPDGGPQGRPAVFSIVGNSILFGPTPDDAYTVNVEYYGRFDPLASTPTNGLLTYQPNLYLYACLREASLFVMDDERASHWDALYKGVVANLKNADENATHSGSSLRVKAR